MDLGLKGKVALVAAASKGLGRAIAEELAAEGASLVICARGAETLERTAEAIRSSSGADVHPVAADLGTMDGIAAVTKAALAKHGRVDILVTNSGGPPAGLSGQHDWAAWDRAIASMLRSAVELTRAVLPGMRERRWGRILNVTSITVKQPIDDLVLSNAIRAGVTGFARSVANEVAADGITVNNILPGYTRTQRVLDLAQTSVTREGGTVEEKLERIAAQIPAKRLAEPREFAALAAFLASERASYITGQSIAVDGGWIRGLL